MKSFMLIPAILLLTACSISRTPNVSEMDAHSGVVRLTYGQAMLQSAHTDDYLARSEANKACQKMGYVVAIAYGQPITTCTTMSGTQCLNETVTLQYQCQGVATTGLGY